MENAPEMGVKCVATIGMFDGVHRGHQLLIGKVTERARATGMASMVVTFDRPPRLVLDPSFRPQLLTTLSEKASVISGLGVDRLVVLPFSREMAALSARAFMQQVLRERLGVEVLITGYDNRFGHNRAEGFDDYVRYGQEMGMEVQRGDVQLMDDGSCPVSSSVIRRLLAEEGRVDLMPQCLGHDYQLQGVVESGEHIGHRLGFPTANVHPDDGLKLIPAAGVYAVRVLLNGEDCARVGMMNIGTRPTFEGKQQTLEVNIFGFEGNLYGQPVTVMFRERLREERKFESEEALVEQLREDRKMAERLFG